MQNMATHLVPAYTQAAFCLSVYRYLREQKYSRAFYTMAYDLYRLDRPLVNEHTTYNGGIVKHSWMLYSGPKID